MVKKSPKRKDRQYDDGPVDNGGPQLPFNPRMMEKLMADLTRLLASQEFATAEEMDTFLEKLSESGQRIPEYKPETPLEKAQDLIYQAWVTDSSRKKVQLARKALRLSEDCADAYVILAQETADSLEKAKELYEQAVRAGERALGPDAFSKYEEHFWGVIETRPYMRARLELAQCLWYMDQRPQAIVHLEEMLKLNPHDNQGIRYILLPHLLDEKREEEVELLFKTYQEDISAQWLYTQALTLFQKYGSGRRANSKLKAALEANPYVPDYLLGHEEAPLDLPSFTGLGDELEAAHYF